MPRVTEDAVLAIMETTLTADEVAPYLVDASSYITSVMAGEGYGDEDLARIEKWYAAALIYDRNPNIVKSKKVGDASVTFRSDESGNPFWKNVMRFDYKGILANIDKGSGDAEIRSLA